MIMSPGESIIILLLTTAVFNLGFALVTSNVAVNFNVGYAPPLGIDPKYVDARFSITLPEVNPLAESLDALIIT